ncbi:hypothetical protein A54_120 [Septuagintavirus sv54]|uniref:Uncharacterized protein n=1 Tax=Escherichia phage A5-4 TaxID=2996162 RepID=A0AAE9PUY4_9CAUD|nr:hypothetical protein A54_120 [Escherichia phage A5-4]
MLEMLNLSGAAGKVPFKLKKFDITASESIHLLSEAGNLYSISPTNANLSGTGVTTTQWTLVSSGVDDFWAGQASLLFKTKGGSWFITGYNFFVPRVENTPVDVTAKVMAINKSIRKIEMGANAIAFLYTDNTMAVAGSGPHLGLGSNTAVPDLTYVEPPNTSLGIRDVAILDTSVTTWIISGGDVYGCGNGAYSKFSSSNGTGQRTSFVRIPNPINSAPLGLKVGYECVYISGSRTDGDELILGLGNNAYGSLGAASTIATVTDISVVTSSVYSPAYGFYPLAQGLVRRINNNVGITGRTAGTGWGLGTQTYYGITRITTTASPLWGQIFQRGNYTNTYVLAEDGILYGSGGASTGKLPGYTTDQTTYVPLDLTGLE